MYTVSYTKSVLYLIAGILLWITVISPIQADEQVRFSTQNNLLTIPYTIIDQQQIVYDAEMQLQPNGQFALTKINQQPSPQTDFDQEFDLSMDHSIWIKNTEFRLKLSAVTQDSRCPTDAQCIWAGEVSLVFALYQGPTHKQDFLLILGGGGNDSVEIGNVRVTLLQVQPQPSTVTSLIPADYVATLKISQMFD